MWNSSNKKKWMTKENFVMQKPTDDHQNIIYSMLQRAQPPPLWSKPQGQTEHTSNETLLLVISHRDIKWTQNKKYIEDLYFVRQISMAICVYVCVYTQHTNKYIKCYLTGNGSTLQWEGNIQTSNFECSSFTRLAIYNRTCPYKDSQWQHWTATWWLK